MPSNTYNLIKDAPDNGKSGFRRERERNIVVCRKPDLDELSDSDIECLDAAIKFWGNAPVWKLLQESHDDAWQAAWNQRGDKGSKVMALESIVSLLEDSEELLTHLETHHDD